MTFAFVSTDKAPAGLVDSAEIWRANRARVEEVPCHWLEGTDDPQAVSRIAAAVRLVSDPVVAVAATEDALDRGLSARSIFDGLILPDWIARTAAATCTRSRVEALRDAHLAASSPRVKLLILLQAAAQVALSRPMPAGSMPFTEAAPDPATLDEVFATSGPTSSLRALGYLLGGESRPLTWIG